MAAKPPFFIQCTVLDMIIWMGLLVVNVCFDGFVCLIDGDQEGGEGVEKGKS